MSEVKLASVEALLLGHATGDALGVPVEFNSRAKLKKTPVVDMRGNGTYAVPAGTWSDDTSMTIALLESMGRLQRIDYEDIMKNFIKWMNGGSFTATGKVFDIGGATEAALDNAGQGIDPILCGGAEERDNGNGSLMRVSPLAPYLYARYGCDLPEEAAHIIHNISALTHRHPRSQMACGLYVLVAARLLAGKPLKEAITEGLAYGRAYYEHNSPFREEVPAYQRIWDADTLAALPLDEIKSGGYVVYTWEAALYCLLTTTSYQECVLKAVNLGEDTDTIGAITGGLAGLAYGLEAIPQAWLDTLQKRDEIKKLCEQFMQCL